MKPLIGVPPEIKLPVPLKIYNVPKGQQCSWVSMAVDSKGRLYCGDQGGQGIFRITLSSGAPVIEKVPVPVSGAHGLLWAFDSLYEQETATNSISKEDWWSNHNDLAILTTFHKERQN